MSDCNQLHENAQRWRWWATKIADGKFDEIEAVFASLKDSDSISVAQLNGLIDSGRRRFPVAGQFDKLPQPDTIEPMNTPGTNTGHGHVWPRPDGAKARCGGPGLCPECSRDAARSKTP